MTDVHGVVIPTSSLHPDSDPDRPRVEHPQDISVHCGLCPDSFAGQAAAEEHLRQEHPGLEPTA